MKPNPAFVLAFAAAALAACTSRYEKPTASITPAEQAVSQSAEGLSVDGLVEFGRKFPWGHGPKGTGQLAVQGDTIRWRNGSDAKRNFEIKTDAVREVDLECATRAGGNLCLEIQIHTVTGFTYAFRDPDWAGGQNGRIQRVYDFLKANYPKVVFAEKPVDSVD